MVFSGLTFLYFFLPVTLILYYVWNNRIYRNAVLLIMSLIFYSWGEPKLLGLMLLVCFVAYLSGLGIEHFRKAGKKGAQKAIFITSVVLIAGNLFVFKYLNFTFDSISALLGLDINIVKIALPIGISFYTFQILSYVIDLYKGTVGVQKNFFYLALYMTFFPQLIAGPIVRYETVEMEIRERRETWEDVAEGIKRFVIGLGKKAIIANGVAMIPEIVYGGDGAIYGTAMYYLAAVGYALQIYFDFSGYSDMAIGMGRMFGFHFLENFNYPYIATSITDFWRRWHISLSSWFRDYIYIPLGGNRVGKLRHVFNILFVWALTGFWHGADWNFVLWGLYYGVLLLVEKFVLNKVLDKVPVVLRWCYSMFFVLIGWVIFNVTDMTALGEALKTMLTLNPTDIGAVIASNTDILFAIIYIPIGIVCMFPWAKKIKLPDNVWVKAIEYILCLVLLILCVIFIISSSYNPFIYYRF